MSLIIYILKYPFSGGAETRFWEIHKRLAGRFDIHLITSSLGKKDDEVIDGISVHCIPTLWSSCINVKVNFYARPAHFYMKLPHRLRKLAADAAIVNDDMSPVPTFPGLFLKRDVATILHFHEIGGETNLKLFGAFGIPIWLSEKMMSIIRYDEYVASIPEAGRVLKRKYGIGSQVVPGGVDTKVFMPGRNVGGDLNILNIGRMTPQKNQIDFLRLARRILDEEKRVRFTIIGTGPLEKYLKEKAAELGISKRVTFLKNLHIRDYVKAIQGCDICVITENVQAGFGIVNVEALSCGKPLVAYDIPGRADVVSPESGFLVRPNDFEALAQKTLMLVDDAHLRSRIGLAARSHVTRNFDYDVIAKKMGKIYEKYL